MHYNFPCIEHIDDVLPAIAGRDEFIVVQKDGYQVVNYAVMMEDSFPPVDQSPELEFDILAQRNAIRRECRGLVFDLDGKLIGRRYHKFFNVNERDETRFESVDFSKPHVVLDKLDGSMVSPCGIKGHILWMTKMGVTDTSMEAETFVATHPKYIEFAKETLEDGWTPVFEWCSNKNRIVLNYPEDQLVLTAVRHNETGYYVRHELLQAYGKKYDMPVVKSYDYKSKDILEIVRKLEDTEGVVIRFFDGHMLKVKADWYVLRHKSKDAITREKNVLDYVVNERVDDVLPFLQAEDQSQLMRFQGQFWLGVDAMVALYQEYCNSITVDRKTWAMEHLPERKQVDQHIGTIVFGWYDGRDIKETLVNIIRKNIGTQKRVNENRYLWGGYSWSYNFDGDA
jgi:RNA ligase